MNQNKLAYYRKHQGPKEKNFIHPRIVDTSLVAIDTINIDSSSVFESDIELQSPEMLYLFLDRGTTTH
jgi:hypothetical protein